MGIDMSATILVGWEVHQDTFFEKTSKMVTTESCEHPNLHRLKHCGKCGKEFKTKTREHTTERLRPQFLNLFGKAYDEDEISTWGVSDCSELFQSWEGPNGVRVHERLTDGRFDYYVMGLTVTYWDPKYETHAESFSFGELEAKRLLVWKALGELGLDVHLNDIKIHVWGDMH